MLKLLIGISALACGAVASAQNADFRALMESTNAKVPPPSKAAIEADALATVKAIASNEGAQCIPSGIDTDAPKAATSTRMAVAAIMAGQVKNMWTVYGRPKGCASSMPTRFMVVQLADDKVIARTVNDGESLANPSLMRDTSAQAALAVYQAVRSADAGCNGDGMRMIGTRVLSRSADLGPDFYGSYFKGSWQEAWTFEVCGKRGEVAVTFRADGDGGAYTDISSADVTLAN